jgi:YHS domain-containing protein
MIKLFCALVLLTSLISCSNTQQVAPLTRPVELANADTSKYPVSMVDNKKDLVCGMPLSAGIYDTAHYNGKVFGFCSEECKDAFKKEPKKYAAKNK